MSYFGINEMLKMQKALQEKYKDKWGHDEEIEGKCLKIIQTGD